ncbi:hypothetical protein ACFRI7_14625 [Streptomyces sp. NPDC056716]|uniref:hypothetical protein n=1 Tax=unclassified Streptomyces TaxID=2593676 RepID=UPI0036B37F94
MAWTSIERGAPSVRYNAFISYSHGADSRKAHQLRGALHDFARPWNRLRALRVFLDNSVLSADPSGLWPILERSLEESDFFLLLASPGSARSEWVGQEIIWWRGGPRPRQLIVVVTGGEVAWDHAAGDFDWERSTCLNEALRGHFTEEPRWVDLRWMGEDHSGDLRDARFQAAVADLAAPLHRRAKDELIGEDITQRRRLRRFRRGMTAGVTALAVLAAVAAVFAFVQRDTARDQARLATARQLAAQALNLSGDNLEVASLLALQAYELERDDPETRSALYRLATYSPRLVRYVRADDPVTAVALTAEPRYVAVGTSGGAVEVWTSDGSRKVRTIEVPGTVDRLAFSDDGQALAVSTVSGRVVVQGLGDGGERRELAGGDRRLHGLAFQPFEQRLVTIDSAGALRFYEDTGDEPVETVDTGIGGSVGLSFLDVGSKVFVVTPVGWTVYAADGEGMAEYASSDQILYPFNDWLSAASPTGLCFGFVKHSEVDLYSPAELIQGELETPEGEPVDTVPAQRACGERPGMLDKEAQILAVSDGGRAAVGTSDGLVVSTPMTEEGRGSLETLTGVEAPDALAFSPGDGDRLASADGRTVALWNLTAPGPSAGVPGVDVPDATMMATQHPLTVGPDGSLAWSHDPDEDTSATLEAWSPGSPGDRTLTGPEAGSWYESMAYDAEGRTLHTAAFGTLETWDVSSAGLTLKHTVTLPRTGDDYSGRAEIAARADGKVAVVPNDGSVVLVDPGTGETSTLADGRTARLTAQQREEYETAAYARALGERGGLAAVEDEEGRVDVYELPSGRRTFRLNVGASGSRAAVSEGRMRTPALAGSAVQGLYLAEDDRALYAVVGDILQRWDLRTGKLLWRSEGADSLMITADPAGRWVASLASDGTVWLWDARTGGRMGSVQLPLVFTLDGITSTGRHSSIAFAPDGARLWSISEGGALLSWDTTVEGWLKSVCDRVGRPLTEAERTRYLTSVSDGPRPCS